MISVRSLSLAFGKTTVLREVSFELQEGASLAVVGPSGSGKTTLLRAIAGLVEPGGGEVWIGGRLCSKRGFVTAPSSRGAGMVFQHHALWPHMTVAQNVGFALDAMPRQAARERVAEMLWQLGLQDLAARLPHEISGGQAQRAAIARALAPRPAILLLDEPFSHLDEENQQVVFGRLSETLAGGATTLVAVLHEPLLAPRLCTSVVLLDEGKLLGSGSWQDLRGRSRWVQSTGPAGESGQ